MISLIHNKTREKVSLPPLGIAYLCGALKEKGIKSIYIVDLAANESIDLKLLRQSKLIGISAVSVGFSNIINLIKEIKTNTGIPIVLGGAHASMFGASILREIPKLDYCIKGEGEESFIELLENQNYHEISGLIYREKEEIIDNKVRVIENLDSLPLPSYDHFNLTNYPLFPERMLISTSRGCPYRCIYCGIHKIMGNRYRFKSPLSVVNEIEFFIKKYGTRFFDIVDDNFTVRKQRVYEICDLILKRGLNINFAVGSGVRVDGIDKELLRKMKEAGLIKLSFGIESTDEGVLNAIKKDTENYEYMEELCKYAHELGISTKGFFIVGSPQDNFTKVKNSMDFAKKLKLTSIAISMLTPLPGTELWDWVRENGKCLQDPKEYLYENTLQPVDNVVPFETEDFRKEERLKAYRYALKVRDQIQHRRRRRLLSVLKRVLKVDEAKACYGKCLDLLKIS